MNVLNKAKLPRDNTEVILCCIGNRRREFVTWMRSLDDGGRYWGHYFPVGDRNETDVLVEAAAD